jgi:hypothetical protein
VLEDGEAMVERMPVPRLESLRHRVRSELQAAIGGSIRSAKIGHALAEAMVRPRQSRKDTQGSAGGHAGA